MSVMRPGGAGSGDVGHAVELLGDPCESRFMNLVAEAVVSLEAHDQRAPLVGIDPIGYTLHQDVRVNVNARHADFEADDPTASDIIVFHEIMFRGNDALHLDRTFQDAGR